MTQNLLILIVAAALVLVSLLNSSAALVLVLFFALIGIRHAVRMSVALYDCARSLNKDKTDDDHKDVSTRP